MQANTPPWSLSLSLSLWTKTNEAHLPAAPASSNDNISIRRFYGACIRLTDMVKTFFGAIGIDTSDGESYAHGFEKKRLCKRYSFHFISGLLETKHIPEKEIA